MSDIFKRYRVYITSLYGSSIDFDNILSVKKFLQGYQNLPNTFYFREVVVRPGAGTPSALSIEEINVDDKFNGVINKYYKLHIIAISGSDGTTGATHTFQFNTKAELKRFIASYIAVYNSWGLIKYSVDEVTNTFDSITHNLSATSVSVPLANL